MIDIGKYTKVLGAGLLLDHYSVLCSIRDGIALPKSKRIDGFINLLCKKGYIDEGALTDLAYNLIEDDVIMKVQKAEPVSTTTTTTLEPKEFDFNIWVLRLHEKIVQKIVEKTGKRQVRGKIQGATYSFLPNATDLGKVLVRAINAYKLSDFDKIERCILRYVDRKVKEDTWFPILQYYIMKKDMSAMVTDMENIEDDDKPDINDSTVNI